MSCSSWATAAALLLFFLSLVLKDTARVLLLLVYSWTAASSKPLYLRVFPVPVLQTVPKLSWKYSFPKNLLCKLLRSAHLREGMQVSSTVRGRSSVMIVICNDLLLSFFFFFSKLFLFIMFQRTLSLGRKHQFYRNIIFWKYIND